jgi:hypothetical protein
METQTRFIGYRRGVAVFTLRCAECGTTGELSVAAANRNRLLPCPGKCGRYFIQRQGRGFFAVPELTLAIAARKRPKSVSRRAGRKAQ